MLQQSQKPRKTVLMSSKKFDVPSSMIKLSNMDDDKDSSGPNQMMEHLNVIDEKQKRAKNNTKSTS